MTQHIFLSPHLDDVILSCGGLLASLIEQAQPVKIVTIFAGVPPQNTPFSPFAEYQHRMWGNPEIAYATRQTEDRAAAATLGLTPVWLQFLDCIYRGDPASHRWFYTSDEDIFGLVHPAETSFPRRLAFAIEKAADALAIGEETIFYAPLTMGNHVDHQLVLLAVLQLLKLRLVKNSYRLKFYEDYPYIQRDPAQLRPSLDYVRRQVVRIFDCASASLTWLPEPVALTDVHVQQRIEAIAAYQSQMEILFGGKTAMTKAVTAQAAERLWTLTLPAGRKII